MRLISANATPSPACAAQRNLPANSATTGENKHANFAKIYASQQKLYNNFGKCVKLQIRQAAIRKRNHMATEMRKHASNAFSTFQHSVVCAAKHTCFSCACEYFSH